jgi:hypothetical protein
MANQRSRFEGVAAILREKPETNVVADIRHWIRVYGELRRVARDWGVHDFSAECEQRLDFWLARAADVEVGSAVADTRTRAT